MQSFLSKIIPFIFLGIMIVLLVAGIIVLSYLLIFGAIVGLVLFTFAWIKDRFFKKKTDILTASKSRRGRTIDHRDL